MKYIFVLYMAVTCMSYVDARHPPKSVNRIQGAQD